MHFGVLAKTLIKAAVPDRKLEIVLALTSSANNNHQNARAMIQQTSGEIPGYNSECMQNVTYNREQYLAGNNPDCVSSVDQSSIFTCCNGQREREAVSPGGTTCL